MSVRLRIDLAYDGSAFRGFARQREQTTVQGVLEDALSRLCGAPITTTGAGRTDAGVHALAQVVHCDVPADSRLLRDLDRARGALAKLCGPAITIWGLQEAPDTFNARFSASARGYVYRLCDAVAMPPLWRHDTWHVGEPLDESAMEAAGRQLIGEHDFASFCRRAGDQHLQRRILALKVRRRPRGLVGVSVEGQAFCHQMVRSIVGCLVEVGRGRKEPDWLAEVLAAQDRQAAARVAPPHGLTLVRVSYAGGRQQR